VECSFSSIFYVSESFCCLHCKQEHSVSILCCLQQATGGGDGGYDDFQEGTSGGVGGYGGYGGFSGYGGTYDGHTHDDDDEEEDDEEGSDDEEDDDEEVHQLVLAHSGHLLNYNNTDTLGYLIQ
jgi:hypothetical protein